jgi:hypothetical protein
MKGSFTAALRTVRRRLWPNWVSRWNWVVCTSTRVCDVVKKQRSGSIYRGMAGGGWDSKIFQCTGELTRAGRATTSVRWTPINWTAPPHGLCATSWKIFIAAASPILSHDGVLIPGEICWTTVNSTPARPNSNGYCFKFYVVACKRIYIKVVPGLMFFHFGITTMSKILMD